MTRISSHKRVRAGRLLALLYLLCVVLPSSAFAFGNARLADHCLFEDGLTPLVSRKHNETGGIAHQSDHLQAGGHSHSMHHHDVAKLAPQSQPKLPSHDGPAPIDLQCCGMMSVAALPASLAEVRTPCPTIAFIVSDRNRPMADSLPLQRYRPPIA